MTSCFDIILKTMWLLYQSDLQLYSQSVKRVSSGTSGNKTYDNLQPLFISRLLLDLFFIYFYLFKSLFTVGINDSQS